MCVCVCVCILLLCACVHGCFFTASGSNHAVLHNLVSSTDDIIVLGDPHVRRREDIHQDGDDEEEEDTPGINDNSQNIA